MPNVLIRELPEDVHTELARRAAQRGQSLQQYLVAELTRLMTIPTLDEVLDRIERRGGGRRGPGGFQAAMEALEGERSRR